MTVSIDIPENKVPFMMELLQNLNFVAKNTQDDKVKNSSIEAGQFNVGEKPSDFAGIWKDDKRDLKQLRASAWKQRS